MKIAPAEEDLTWSWEKARSGLVFGLVGGLSSRQLTERLTLSPNEGIRRSVKNGLLILFFGLVGGLSVGLVVGLLGGLLFRLVNALLGGLLVALVVGLLGGLSVGLGAAVQHYILRFWLSCTHTFPWKAVPFLEDATKRILLRRVCGGYSFAHRLLLDYFADQRLGSAPAAPPSSIPTRTSHAADDATQ
jgi:hypothetical protein